MRSKYLQKLAATALTTGLGVGGGFAGNLDQLNYVGVPGDRVSSLFTVPNNTVFPANPFFDNPYIELMNPAVPVPPPTFISSLPGNPQNSATMIRGYIEPPQTGAYVFFVNGSADAEFYLSTNTTDGNKTRIAYTDGTTGVGEWGRRLTQRSAPVSLEKGKQYFFELIQKSSGVGGHAQVGWWLPDYTLERPIPIRYAQRFPWAATCPSGCTGSFIAEGSFPTPIFDRSPGNNGGNNDNQIFITENRPYDLSPWLTTQHPVTHQWEEMQGYTGPGTGNAVAIDGEITSTKYIASAVAAQHNNKAYRLRTRNTTTGNSATSRVSRVFVINDSVAPTIVAASAAGSTNGFNVVFSENVDPNTATNKANFVVNNGVVIDRIEMRYGETPNNTVVVKTVGPIPGNTTVTVSNVRDLAANPNTIIANSVVDVLLTDGIISYFAYGAINGGAAIGGTAVSDMINQTNRYTSLSTDPANRRPFPGEPNLATTRTEIGIPQNVANDYGVLLTGFIIPPQTGLYNIVIAGDDQSIVYISQTDNPATKVAVATDPVWNGFRAYTTTTRRTMNNTQNNGFISSNFPGRPVAGNNATIPANQSKHTLGGTLLTRGNKHFIEVLMKEGGGGDNVDVTWQLPGTWNINNNNGLADGQAPIPGLYLSQAAAPGQSGPISIVQQPADATTLENRPVTFAVVHGGSPSFSYQWYKDGIIIPDANARTYTEQLPDPLTEDGAVYSVVVRNLFSGATSANATLTVTDDEAGPQLVRAVGSASFNSVTIWFDEVVDPGTATNPANYSIVETGTANQLGILGNGTMAGPGPGGFTRVVFPTGQQAQGVNYTITVNGVKDIANSGNTITANSTVSFTGWVVSKGFALYEVWFDINGGNVDTVRNDPRYPGNPSRTSYKALWESDQDIAEQFGGRLSGYFFAAAGAGRYDFFMASDDNGGLWIGNNSSSGPLDTVRLATEPAWGNRRSWTGTSDGRRAEGDNNTVGDNIAALNLAAGERRYMELIYKEGGGGDYGDATMKTPTGAIPANGSTSTMSGAFIGALANPDETTWTFSQNIEPAYTNGEGTTRALNTAGSGQTLTDKLNNPQTQSAVFYQWQRRAPGTTNWTDIPGANSANYTVPFILFDQDQVGYRLQANIPGKTSYSVETTITVIEDVTAPTVLSASVAPSPDGVQNRVRINFSEPINAGLLTSLANYALTEGNNVIGITNIASRDNNTVVYLTTDEPLVGGTSYQLVVNNLTDQALAANTLSPNPTVKTVTGWNEGTGYVRREQYNDIGGGRIGNLTGNAKFVNNFPDVVAYSRDIQTPTGIRDDFGQRLTGFITPAETADYLFAISADDESVLYLSTDATAANKVAIVTEPEWGGERDWNGTDRRIHDQRTVRDGDLFTNIRTLPVNRSQNTVGAKTLTAGVKYYFEVITKEGGGGDNCAVTWWKNGDPMPGNGSAALSGNVLSTFVNPDNVISITGQPQGGNVVAGGSITLSVTASANGAFGNNLYYQWRKGGVNVNGATGASLALSNVQAGDAGNYDVVIQSAGAANVTSAVAAVTVGGVVDPGAPTLAISKTGNNVTVTYPNANQVAGHALEKSTALPGGFAAETGGADVGGTYTKTVDVTAQGAPGETYWRTRKP